MSLYAEQERHKSALNDLEQYGRRECLEISGIHPIEGENCKDITIKVAKAMGVDIGKDDIVASHRIRKAKGDPVIISKFLNRKTKENIMANRKHLKNKTAGLILCTEDAKAQNQIFVSESLTVVNRNLFQFARAKCQENDWKFLWTRNGVV